MIVHKIRKAERKKRDSKRVVIDILDTNSEEGSEARLVKSKKPEGLKRSFKRNKMALGIAKNKSHDNLLNLVEQHSFEEQPSPDKA